MTRPAKPATAYAGTRIRVPVAACRAYAITESVQRMHNPGLGVATPTIFIYENHLIE